MKKKIIINNNITIYDSPSDGIPYISDVKVVEAVSNNKGIEIGGTAANKLSFRLFNPPMEHLDGAKIEVFIQDVAEVDEVLETLIDLETDTIDTDLVIQDIVVDTANNSTDTAADSDDIAGFLEGYDTTIETIDTNAEASTYDPVDTDEDDATETPGTVNQETRDDEYDDATEAEAAENMDDGWQAMGTFYVTKVKSDKSNDMLMVTALDGFGVMNGYFEPTNASATLDNSYADFKTQLAGIGLIAEDETFPTDSSFAIKKMKFRDAVATFAGLAGGYGNFNRYGTLDLRRYKINDSYLIGDAEIHSVNTADDEFIIDSVLCGDPNGDNLISPSGGVYGDGTLIFENDYMTQDILDEIKTAYEDLHWQPCEIVCSWHYGMTAGDIVKAKIGDEFSYISISYIEIDLDIETCKIKSFGESSTQHIKKIERGNTSTVKVEPVDYDFTAFLRADNLKEEAIREKVVAGDGKIINSPHEFRFDLFSFQVGHFKIPSGWDSVTITKEDGFIPYTDLLGSDYKPPCIAFTDTSANIKFGIYEPESLWNAWARGQCLEIYRPDGVTGEITGRWATLGIRWE